MRAKWNEYIAKHKDAPFEQGLLREEVNALEQANSALKIMQTAK